MGKDGQIRSMALALARDAFFGEEVMTQCTAQGWDDIPGLPHKVDGTQGQTVQTLPVRATGTTPQLLKSSGTTAAKLVNG